MLDIALSFQAVFLEIRNRNCSRQPNNLWGLVESYAGGGFVKPQLYGSQEDSWKSKGDGWL